MTQPADSHNPYPIDLLEFFRSSATDGSDSGAPTLSERALMSFTAFCAGEDISSEDALSENVRNWIVRMKIAGHSLSTAVRYVKAVSALFSKAVREHAIPPSTLFRDIIAQLRENGDSIWNDNVAPDDFSRLIAHTKKAFHNPAARDLPSDIVIFSLLNGCRPLQAVATLRTADAAGLSPESADIIARNREKKRQYLFPLGQGNLTPRQLAATLLALGAEAFAKAGVAAPGDDDTLRSFWACAALGAGFAPSAVAAYLGQTPGRMKILSLCRPVTLSDDDRERISAGAASIFVSNPRRWYAMRLRTRVTFDELTARLSRLKDITTPELFYPCREIARRVGKKTLFESEPIVRDIVYFKTRATAIFPLFRRIGDLAWCYKTDGRDGASYAAISERSFREFQETIGCFTPEYNSYFSSGTLLRENDGVRVVGGLLKGRSGKLLKVMDGSPDGIVRYLVEIWNEIHSRKISAEVDSRQVKPLA